MLQQSTSRTTSRRAILKNVPFGFGYLAFAGMLGKQAAAAPESASPLAPKQPHITPRAKRVIFLCMRGGPSQMETFDPKPLLEKKAGEEGVRNKKLQIVGPKTGFKRYGESGLPVSDLFPHVARRIDELCVIRSMQTETPAHPQAYQFLHTGSFRFVRPSIGSWVTYGLGTENQNLPGFIAIGPTDKFGGAQNYGSGFLPAAYHGTPIGEMGRPVENAGLNDMKNPRLSMAEQRRQVDLIQSMNRGALDRQKADRRIDGLIESYELGFRMQSAVPEVMDLQSESKATIDMYGIDGSKSDEFGRRCLMARRLIESGVRFVEVGHERWDHHNDLKGRLEDRCLKTDKPIAGLLADLKQRGLLEDTLVVWGGEFGRTPDDKISNGRAHNNKGFTFWLAGGGVKAGIAYGATDEFGYKAVENPVHMHDLHATILHLLGLDHQQLTYRYSGRDFRLTDVHGNVVHDIIG